MKCFEQTRVHGLTVFVEILFLLIFCSHSRLRRSVRSAINLPLVVITIGIWWKEMPFPFCSLLEQSLTQHVTTILIKYPRKMSRPVSKFHCLQVGYRVRQRLFDLSHVIRTFGDVNRDPSIVTVGQSTVQDLARVGLPTCRRVQGTGIVLLLGN